MRPILASLALLMVATACGPVSVVQAEATCFERARLAAGPRGEIRVGASTDKGPYVGTKLEISSDYFQGRDPSALYDACVYQKSGQPPRQPLYSRTDWKG